MNHKRVFTAVLLCGLLTAGCLLYSTDYFGPISGFFQQTTDRPFRSPAPKSTSLSHVISTHPPLPPPSPPPPSKSKEASAPIPTSHLPVITPELDAIKKKPDVFNDVPVNGTAEDGTKLKIILYWNEAYGNKHFGLGFGRKPFELAGCRVNTCLATGDRKRYPMSEVDAVLWHFRSNDRSLPKERSPHTRYIFWMMESASYLFGDVNKYKNVFNWTFTYRRDSDIYNPYGRVYQRIHPLPLPPTPRNYAEGKTKMIAWFVSNCHTLSGREIMVEQLQKLIPVDVYGKCGKLRCERSEFSKCEKMLSRDYKFYLSFENSLCLDYITEKFYNRLNADVIPVVWGSGPYKEIAPPHSYIDALKFPSVRVLAEYLLYLDRNDTAYNEFFRWKPYHQQSSDWSRKAAAFCDLCEKLHSDEPPKTYDLNKWFVKDSHCHTYRDPAVHRIIYGRGKT